MDTLAEGLWELADYHEQNNELAKAIKCLEAICQSPVSFLPTIEVKTRLRIATLLLRHSHNVNHAKAHLERSQLLLKSIPSCFELKCRSCSLLSQCYYLVGAIPSQKQILNKGLELTKSLGDGFAAKLWYCNFSSQLSTALIIEGDYRSSLATLGQGYNCAAEICYPELQWDDMHLVEQALAKCDEVWNSLEFDKRQQCLGLLFYNELLHIFYRFRVCDYKNVSEHISKLDAAMKADMQPAEHVHDPASEPNALKQQPRVTTRSHLVPQGCPDSASVEYERRLSVDKLQLAPYPIDGEWLPKNAVYALVDLAVVIFGRPKGHFKECAKRIQSGIQVIKVELSKLGINDGVREVDLQHSAIWMAGVYLMLLMQFLENKVAMDLTRADFVEAQEALMQMKNWFIRFPTILQACESIIEMLRGQYAHSVGCFNEAAFHFVEAAKLTESKSVQSLCQVYAALSHICVGDAESTSQALDLIAPVYRVMDSFAGAREKTSVLFGYGLLLMKQQNLQEARIRLASGLQITHSTLGNLQLVSQYLTVLGSLALALHDTTQAREILRSALTLAKKLSDVPTQIWVLSVLQALYQELGEGANEMENSEYQKKKIDDLHKRLEDAHASRHHIELISKAKIEVQQVHEFDNKRSMASSSMKVNLDIPESIGLGASTPVASSSRLVDLDSGRRGKRKI